MLRERLTEFKEMQPQWEGKVFKYTVKSTQKDILKRKMRTARVKDEEQSSRQQNRTFQCQETADRQRRKAPKLPQPRAPPWEAWHALHLVLLLKGSRSAYCILPAVK